MENLQQFVGRKAKGIKFSTEEYPHITYTPGMDKHVGHEGVITSYKESDHSFRIDFESPVKDYWYYPAELILPQLDEDLLGYLLPTDRKYLKIIAGLALYSVEDLEDLMRKDVHFTSNSYIGEIVTKYDLLDKCTPVYKPVEVKLPKINGYEGEDKGKYFQYGCAKLLKSWFSKSANRHLTYMVLDSGIIVNKEQILQIQEYLLYKKK